MIPNLWHIKPLDSDIPLFPNKRKSNVLDSI